MVITLNWGNFKGNFCNGYNHNINSITIINWKKRDAFAFRNASDGFVQKQLKLSTSAFSKEAIQPS